MGSAMADQLVSLVGENGKILFMGNVYLANIQTGFRGFQYRMSTYPNIELFGPEDDSGIGDDVTVTPRARVEAITIEWLKRHPDIGGVAGFDYLSGPEIASALEKMGLAGKVKVVCVDAEARHIEY
jgi:ABC-type sugar transport system substrate-binding protein